MRENRVDVLIANEVQNLVDLRAKNKIAIFYPNLRDEKELLSKIQKTIKHVNERLRFDENYLFFLGFATRKEEKKAILWKGYLLDKNGEVTSTKERHISETGLVRTGPVKHAHPLTTSTPPPKNHAKKPKTSTAQKNFHVEAKNTNLSISPAKQSRRRNFHLVTLQANGKTKPVSRVTY